MNPTARSKQYLEKQGFIVCKVEQRVKFPIPGKEVQGNYLKDAFGFGDLLYMGHGVIGLCQATSGGNKASRVQKILGLSEAKEWLKCDGKILVHGWAKRGPRGGRKLWSAGESIISLANPADSNSPLNEADMAFMELPQDLQADTQPKRQRRGKSQPKSTAKASIASSPGLFDGQEV